MAKTLIFYRICMICISFEWKFTPEFIFSHLEVIRGHLMGSKKVIWGRKSVIWPNAHDMHTIRLEIFFWIQWYASQGHPRSSYGVKKGHFGVENRKCGQMHMICISIDSKFYSDSNDVHLEVIRGHLRGQKRSFGVINLKHG